MAKKHLVQSKKHSVDRRAFLKTAGSIAGASTLLPFFNNCSPFQGAALSNGQSSSSTGPSGSPPPTAVPLPPAPIGKYRSKQKYLFQTVESRYLKSRLPDGTDLEHDIFGPTSNHVDFHTGWKWDQAGGDWIDKDKVRYGTKSWFDLALDKTTGSTASADYTVDVSSAVQFIHLENRWNAFLFDCPNAPRAIATPFHTTLSAPSIIVNYQDGTSATLHCRVVAVNSVGSIGPNTTSNSVSLPAFVEFERPSQPVMSAQLKLTVTEHWSGANPMLTAYILDPPVTPDSGFLGLASTSSGLLDSGIEANSSVIGAHHYLDGTTLSQFAYSGESNYGVERNFDPAIWNNGPTDLTKFPHAGLGQWINADPNRWSIVNSNYAGEGFEPLAPGLGALKIIMPKQLGITDGSTVGYSGDLAANGMIFLPEPLFGNLDRIFVRYYFRLGSPYTANKLNRYHVYNSPGSTSWTTHAGKFGIGPDHSTAYGGVSGSSGGGNGWQMRLVWADCDAGTAGPSEGGWATGFHLYDFSFQNPPGYNYGSQDSSAEERWGQKGGAGGVLYTNQWYCIETELKLNTVSNASPGFTPDGALRAWIDGRLVFERTGMVFRTLPLVNAAYNSERVRPCRQLGVRGLWLDWFHGGKTLASVDRTSFYTGLVWSKEYIGPMRLPSK